MKETDVKRQVTQWLNLHNILYHLVPNQGTWDAKRGCYRSFNGTSGAPDLVAIISGDYIGIELKRPKSGKDRGGIQSVAQKDFQKRVESAGGIYLLVSSIDDLEQLKEFYDI